MIYVLVWGKRWRNRTLEQFQSTCLRCRTNGDFTRFLATEYRHLFWIPLGNTGTTQHRIVCGHCGDQRHVRDLTDLDSPMLADLYGRALRAGVASLELASNDHVRQQAAFDALHPFFGTITHGEVAAERGSAAPADVTELLADLRENAHGSIGRRWLASLHLVSAVGPHPPSSPDLIRSYGVALLLSASQIDDIQASLDPKQGDTP